MPNTETFNSSTLNSWPSSLGELAKSDDPDFLAGLNSTVSIEFDVRSAGTAAGLRGGNKPNWQPIPGFDAVPCRIVWKSSVPAQGGGQPSEVMMGRILFGQAIPADRRNRIVYTDAGTGETCYGYFLGPVRNAHQQNHHWVGDLQDKPL
jgi:hypothetical protein